MGKDYSAYSEGMTKLELMSANASQILNLLKDKEIISTIKYAQEGQNLFVLIDKGLEGEVKFDMNLTEVQSEDVPITLLNEIMHNITVANYEGATPSDAVLQVAERYKDLNKKFESLQSIDLKNDYGNLTDDYLKAFNSLNELASEVKASSLTSHKLADTLMFHYFDKRSMEYFCDDYLKMSKEDLNKEQESLKSQIGVDIDGCPKILELVMNFHLFYNLSRDDAFKTSLLGN